MKSLSADTTKRKNRTTGETPIWILKCPFPSTGTIYLSDQIVYVPTLDSGIITKSWVAQWGSIDENISSGFSSSLVADFSLQVLIAQFATANIEQILWTAANNIEVTDCELYLWLYGATDAPEKLWTGNIADFRKVSDLAYELQLTDQGTKYNKYIGTLTNKTDFPNIYDGNCGKIVPIVYGKAYRVPCTAVDETNLLFVIADHPCQAINTVYVDGIAITNGVTKYASGTTGCSGRACVKLTHGVKKAKSKFKPTSSSGWVDPANSIDGSDSSYAYTNGVGNTHTVNFDFSTVNGQVISKTVHCKVRCNAGSNTNSYITVGSSKICDAPSQQYGSDVTVDCWITIPTGQNDITFTFNRSGSNGGFGYVYEVYDCEVEYYEYNQTGKCNSDIIINGTVAVDVQGYVSDGSHSNAFGANGTLIERPDYVLKHLAHIYLDLDTANFVTNTEMPFSTDQYKFSAVLNEYQTFRHWAEKMAWECRSYVRWYAGSLHLLHRPDSLTSQKTIAAGMVRNGSVSIERTPLDEVTNTTIARSGRYWNETGENAYQAFYENNDTVSITRYGKKEYPARFIFDFITGGVLTEEGDTNNQLSSWVINGATLSNTDYYRLYWSFGYSAGYSVLYLYSNPAKTTAVATGLRIGAGTMTIAPLNSSGITGSVVCTAYVAADNDAGNVLYLPGSNIVCNQVVNFYLARYKDRKKIVTFDCFLDNMELEFGDAITIAPLGNLLCEVQKVNFAPGSAKAKRNDMITIVAREY